MTVKQFGWSVAIGVVSALVASYLKDRLSPSQSNSEM